MRTSFAIAVTATVGLSFAPLAFAQTNDAKLGKVHGIIVFEREDN